MTVINQRKCFRRKNGADVMTPLELEERKREMLFKQVPEKGKLDLNVVNQSVYFFS